MNRRRSGRTLLIRETAPSRMRTSGPATERPLYQIRLRVPAEARAGDLGVAITQGVAQSNPGVLPVRRRRSLLSHPIVTAVTFPRTPHISLWQFETGARKSGFKTSSTSRPREKAGENVLICVFFS